MHGHDGSQDASDAAQSEHTGRLAEKFERLVEKLGPATSMEDAAKKLLAAGKLHHRLYSERSICERADVVQHTLLNMIGLAAGIADDCANHHEPDFPKKHEESVGALLLVSLLVASALNVEPITALYNTLYMSVVSTDLDK